MLLHHVQPRPELHLSGRWYDPTIGFFTTRDPFRNITGLPQSQHPYAYAHNNPINLTDPSGELVTPDMLWDAAMVLIDAGFLIWDALNPCLDQATREQLMGQDLLFLGADATAFFIPFLPGGGGVALLGRGAAVLAETVVRVPEVIRFGQAVQKGVQIGTHLAETSRGSGSGYRSVDDAQCKLDEWNVPDNLSRSDSRHLDAAGRELLGEQLPGSKPGGHIREVQSARRGLRKALDRIQGIIGSGAWGVEARQYLVEQQSLIQKRLDRIKDVLGY